MKDRSKRERIRPEKRQRRFAGIRAAVLVEYAFLLTAVAIPAVGLIARGGVLMFQEYQAARTHILRPFP